MTLPLSVEALQVRAESGQLLLDIPHLALEPGRSLGIRGPSGAGKSTLLYALSGLLDHLEGHIGWGIPTWSSFLSGVAPPFASAMWA
ncbi:ATP-binding cassette domain-containing protein [Vreelandella azerica]|uniref:ATP-binding cassette domain-containing protein n=1 Tax=Vreelandella azerica TaxID=2732867 RepID=UPI001C12716E|nr:ATP-binding cassette domain-containing protein [Halomonas azerica]